MNKFIIKLITIYQKNPLRTRGHCRYHPTCSSYAISAYKKFNFIYATILTIYRILRCNPLSKGGYDPVPKNRIEKLFKGDYEF